MIPLGRATEFTYDAAGNVTTITDPEDNATTFTYEPTFNRVTSITDALGKLTTFEYDANKDMGSGLTLDITWHKPWTWGDF